MNQDLHPPSPLFRVIPVVDLRSGKAVHAKGGERRAYQSVQSVLCDGDDPIALARAFRFRLNLDALYLADLDAIEYGQPDVSFLRRFASLELDIWADLGIKNDETLDTALASNLSTLILATETLSGPDLLASAVARLGAGRAVFSLDLHDGLPMLAPESSWFSADPLTLVATAIDAGVRRLLLLDVGQIGSGLGVSTLPLLREIRRKFGSVEVIVGGGVGSMADLAAAREAGASGVLVGSALHDGRITADMLAQARHSATAD